MISRRTIAWIIVKLSRLGMFGPAKTKSVNEVERKISTHEYRMYNEIRFSGDKVKRNWK